MNESEKIKEHISSNFQDHEKRLAEEEHHSRLLETLWFDEILSREGTIAAAHRETFEWIFDKSGKAVRPWDNFNAWLENDEGTYWISGKAGSGKSTLMSFLCQDKRTREALTTWSGTKDLFMPKFFFWSSGSKIQRSLEGLLRSLLWQILKEFSNLTLPSFDGEPRPKQNKWTSNRHHLIGAWTKSRLQRALMDVMSQLRSSCCLCFFIDGLDEFDEDEDELVEFVQSIVSSSGVKVCSSSRPHRSFEDAFGPSAKLRLQDLTRKDIQRYVTDRFQDVPQLKSMTRDYQKEMSQLKEDIVDKAQGVFLWVSLAVKDQIRGLRNGDSPEMLQARLALLPPKIKDVYLRMLHQIDPPYQQEATQFLRMALHRPGLSLLEHTLVSYKGLVDMLLSANEVPESEIPSLCQTAQKRIMVTCVGLLEVHQPPYSDARSEYISTRNGEIDFERLESSLDDDTIAFNSDRESIHSSNRAQEVERRDSDPINDGPTSNSESQNTDARLFSFERDTTVDFVHRTAVEFLEGSIPGKEFLQINSPPNFDPQVLYVKALLGVLKSRKWSEDRYVNDGCLGNIMLEAASAEHSTGKVQISLCELIDHTMSIIDRQYLDWCANTHWCTRWGHLARLHAYQDEKSSSTMSSSRSSSCDSYYTTADESIGPSDSTSAPMQSPNFLALAAAYGLSEYVQQRLDREQESISREFLDYLLLCSTSSFPSNLRISVKHFESFDIIPNLLRRGANPNARFYGKTIWNHCLERLVRVRNFNILVYENFTTTPDDPAITRGVTAFIKHAADVKSIWAFQFQGISLAYDIQLSALSLIQLLMPNAPSLLPIRDLCISRDALLYSRCTLLEVRGDKTGQKNVRFFKQYELSVQESRDFMKAFERIASSCRTQSLSAWRQDGQDADDQIIELSQQFDKKRSEASESSCIKTGIYHRCYQGTEWSTFSPKFHLFKQKSYTFYCDAPTSPSKSDDPDYFS